MRNKFIGIIILIVSFSSCNNRVFAKFEIANNSGFKIDSLKIEPMVVTDGKYIAINPNENIKYNADMTGIAKIDGSYRLSYHSNGKTTVKDFGYYTNGFPFEKLIRIEIEKDTIKFDAEFDNY